MIQWVHAGVGLVTLLLLIVFLIVYIGVQSSVTTRRCGAPLQGAQGNPGPKGIAGKALYPGATGDAGDAAGKTGIDGPAAAGIITGPTPEPIGTGFWTGMTGATSWPGPDGPLLDSFQTSAPFNFKFLNNGIGTDFGHYSDTKFFPVTLTCAAGNPSSIVAQCRLFRIGRIVAFQFLQLTFNHGGGADDYIKFDLTPFNTNVNIMEEYFFPISSKATTPYVFDQVITVFDQMKTFVSDGLFHLKVIENAATPNVGLISEMWLQFRSSYILPGTLFPFGQNEGRFPASTPGTFGTATDITVTWLII